MSPLAATLVCFGLYFLGYRFYARRIARRAFELDDSRPTPAHTQGDGRDYVPTRRIVLFGHHYASIAGLAPMLGPAIAVIWGWVPAMIWVVVGTLLVGAVHDFSALCISIRAKGRSIGRIAEDIIGRRAQVPLPRAHRLPHRAGDGGLRAGGGGAVLGGLLSGHGHA